MRQKLPVVLVAGLGGLFTFVDVACAQPWAATTAPNLSWKALASSADGTKMVAVGIACGDPYCISRPATIFVSTNAGASWAQTSAPTNYWISVAASADGVKLVAAAVPYPVWDETNRVVRGGTIYTSPDSGATWIPATAPTNNWTSVAASADGSKLVAVAAPGLVWNGTNYDSVGDGRVYKTLDSGATWTQTSAPTNYWTSVAASADGVRLVAVAASQQVWSGFWNCSSEGVIYSSMDSGVTWSRTSAPTNNWTSVASSADGRQLVAVAAPYYDGNNLVGDGAVYRSLDSGASWTRTTAPSNSWSGVASSADGTKLVTASEIVDGDGRVYTSSDSGATWTATHAPEGNWMAVACSADGYRVVAASFWGEICTMPYSGPWRLADAPPNSWGSVASSADGTKLVAGSYGSIYTSSDSGVTWTPTSASANHWLSVASSADGTKLVAAANQDNSGNLGQIYTSSNSGVTWTQASAPRNLWNCVASSADGAKLVAVATHSEVWIGSDGLIYTSSDSGVTWTQTSAPTRGWGAVASSADGTKLVAAAYSSTYGYADGAIYTSSDSGATWTRTSAPINDWASVASSADGTKLVAGSYGDGSIYISSNSGATWTRISAPTNSWASVASSADGTKLVAVGDSWRVNPGSIYISTNSGATWTPAGAPAVRSWYAVASSADGNLIAAVSWDGPICILRSPAPAPPLPPSPQLAVGLSGANLGLSWLVPSTRFVLQQNSDLSSTNWVDVPTPPTLDYTNLNQRLALTPSLGNSFYRLKQQ